MIKIDPDDYVKWTRKQFEALPKRKRYDEYIECDEIIILPQRTRHDSGFRNMEFVAIRKGKPICRCSGCSDVICLGGIGGSNRVVDPQSGKRQSLVKQVAWCMDCLPTSGLLRFWCDKIMVLGADLSSFGIFYKDER